MQNIASQLRDRHLAHRTIVKWRRKVLERGHYSVVSNSDTDWCSYISCSLLSDSVFTLSCIEFIGLHFGCAFHVICEIHVYCSFAKIMQIPEWILCMYFQFVGSIILCKILVHVNGSMDYRNMKNLKCFIKIHTLAPSFISHRHSMK